MMPMMRSFKKSRSWTMINWSSNYYEGLDEFQHQANDVWFYRMRQLLKDDGVLYVPNLDKTFNKSGEEV